MVPAAATIVRCSEQRPPSSSQHVKPMITSLQPLRSFAKQQKKTILRSRHTFPEVPSRRPRQITKGRPAECLVDELPEERPLLDEEQSKKQNEQLAEEAAERQRQHRHDQRRARRATAPFAL